MSHHAAMMCRRLHCAVFQASAAVILALTPALASAQPARDGSLAVCPLQGAATLEQAGWRPLRLRGHDRDTDYQLHTEGPSPFIQAQADGTMSALLCRVSIDPAKWPVMSFRIRAEQFPRDADLHERKGDDFAVRIYVMFDYDVNKLPFTERMKVKLARAYYGEAMPAAALNYVWDERHPPGTTAWNAFSHRIRMVVVESGAQHLGQWITVTRDVAEDFQAAFDEAPPHIIGIAVATDADNTHSQARGAFGEIVFHAAKPAPAER
jgi:hypothetical protein